MRFDQSLEIGKTGESRIAKWFLGRGYNVLPVYEKVDRDYKGPTLFSADGPILIAPDMLVFKSRSIFWIEAKHKTAFTWHRITGRWTTGIDARHYQEYLRVQDAQPDWPIWLLFLHQNGRAKDTPEGMVSPCGLYGRKLSFLKNHINHRSEKWGKSGMIYWAHESLLLLAHLPEVPL